MAAGDSFVSICNRGLLAIGADRITALTDQVKRAIVCNEIFHPLRRDLLRQHDWNFARRRAVLSASAVAVEFGQNAAFPLPADFLRFMDTDEDDVASLNWVVEQHAGVLCVLSNDSQGGAINIKYISDCQDPTLFDALFCTALAGRIGMEAAEPLARSDKEKARAKSLYDEALALAKSASSQENAPHEFDCDVLLRSRF